MLNQEPVLLRSTGGPRPGKTQNGQDKKQVEKRRLEKERRDREWNHLARISRLFHKAPRQHWSKKEVLSLGEIVSLIGGPDRLLTKFFPVVLFLLYPEAFPGNLVQVRRL